MTASSRPLAEATIHRIAIPNPMFEGEINCYLIAGDPWTLVDTGIGTPEAWKALEAGLAEHGVAVDAVKQIVLTHKHADHMGQAAEIHRRSGATVLVHEDDWEGVTDLDAHHEEFIPLVCQRLRTFHTPEDEVDAIAKLLNHGRRFAEQTPAERLRDGQKLSISGRDLEVIHTPGHTQGSICLRYGRYLISGDTVLPAITPNIGAGEMRRTGMMARYLDSLDRLALLGTSDQLVLPGHGPIFSELGPRVAAMKEHHARREAAIIEILRKDGPKTVYQIARTLWSRLPGYHLALGTSEVNAHLEISCQAQRVRQENGKFRAA